MNSYKMKFQDEIWINFFCDYPLEKKKELVYESGLYFFLKEEHLDDFFTRISSDNLKKILTVLHNKDLFGYLYDSSSFVYDFLMTEIFKPFIKYNTEFKIYHPTIPNFSNVSKMGKKNDLWYELFAYNSVADHKYEIDIRYKHMAESGLSLVLRLGSANANKFFSLIANEYLERIIKILNDPELIGYLYMPKSFIHNFVLCELRSVLNRIDSLSKDDKVITPIPNQKDLELMNNVKHNDLWFEAYINARNYKDREGKDFDLKKECCGEAKLIPIVREEYKKDFFDLIHLSPKYLLVLLKIVHDDRLFNELKTEGTLVRKTVEKILKEVLGVDTYVMPIVEFAKKYAQKRFTIDGFLSLKSPEEQYKYFEETGLGFFLTGLSEKQICYFLKSMNSYKEQFRVILNKIAEHKDLLQDENSLEYQQILELLYPHLLRILGTDNTEHIRKKLNTEEEKPGRKI